MPRPVRIRGCSQSRGGRQNELGLEDLQELHLRLHLYYAYEPGSRPPNHQQQAELHMQHSRLP